MYLNPEDRWSPVQFNPSDTALIQRVNQRRAARSAEDLDGWLWESSYIYSPTFWFNSARFAGNARLTPQAPTTPTRSIRNNRISDVANPTAKVLMWERFDTKQTKRAFSSVTNHPPQWNNTGARPNAAFADGSVSEVNIAELTNLGESTDTNIRDEFRPSGGNWNVPLNLLTGQYYEMRDAWETGSEAKLGFFWYTRGGLKGRDVPRR